MRQKAILLALIVSAGMLSGQTAAPSSQSCAKNVSFSVAEGGMPVPAIPKFAAKWLDGKAPHQRYSNICFSQIPSSTLTSYVVVFSTSEATFQGLAPTAHTYNSTAPGESGAPVSSSGGTWTYSYIGVKPPPPTDSMTLRRDDKPKSLDARAYDQTGRVVARYTLANVSRDKLLEKILADVASDSPSPNSKARIPSPLPVYYVNCDIDGNSENASSSAKLTTASASRTEVAPNIPKPAPPPPPDPQLDISSSPAGADIFLDGEYVGKTPFSMSVATGEHTISIRKKDFSIWQRRVFASAGTRKVAASLEQRVLNLP